MGLIISMIWVWGPVKQVQAGMTLSQLQAKFPNGAYWNHVAQAGHGYQGEYFHTGPCNNPDGYTWRPCDSHNANAGVGGYDCNECEGAIQCVGFARKLGYDVYGSDYRTWGGGSINSIKPLF